MRKVIVSLFCLLGTQAQANYLTPLQEDMLEGSLKPALTRQEMKSLNLIRLWAFDNKEDLINDQVAGSNSLIQNTNVGNSVRPFYCPTNNKVYAQFYGLGKISSNETGLLSKLLMDVSPNLLENGEFFAERLYNFVSTQYSGTLPRGKFDVSIRQNPLLTSEKIKKYEANIHYSSSLVDVKVEDGKYKVYPTDYTIGGWFKPAQFDSNLQKDPMTLFTKYYSGIDGNEYTKEWEIFISGSVIFFHNYRDGYGPVALKYLTQDEEQKFRSQHSDVYGLSRHANIGAASLPPILPAQKSNVQKPSVPTPTPLPPPPSQMPIPYPSGRIVKGTNEVYKEYTARVNMDRIWGAATLGTCYNCADSTRFAPRQKIDIWHYISFSVHLNDPLGPYVDFLIVSDSNPEIFGQEADYKTHKAYMSLEFEDRGKTSYPNLNPIQYSHLIERDYVLEKLKPTGGKVPSYVQSIFEIGSNSRSRPYSGFMRGVYIAKKAFNEREALAMAKRYYPDDRGLCTYQKRPEYNR